MGSCVDADLWKVCAGEIVNVPALNSKVMYFPQGHADHANDVVNFDKYQEIPAFIKCGVASVEYMANVEMDDLYLRMRLVPLKMANDFMEFHELAGCLSEGGANKYFSFTKILTQSDANNGGGFSVPKHCAESLFPELDYTADPPVQNLFVMDVHGKYWKFRHIFRGAPQRHLLTSGWSDFVNNKKLVAGDSVIFLKAGNGDLCIGIRRAKRGISSLKSKCGLWDLPLSGCNSVFGNASKEDLMSVRIPKKNGKVSVETVLETARLAAAGREFEVDYYPQAGFPEFCVKSSVVNDSLRIKWCAGMKFKMGFKSDASKDNWFVGTIQAVQAADPVRWPESPWHMLQVMWEEPSLTTDNVERVSPWSVDISVGGMVMANMPPVPLSPSMKRLRLSQPPGFTLHGQHPTPFPDPFIRNLSYYPVADSALAGVQGARHVQYGNYPLNLHMNTPPNPHLLPQLRQPFTAPFPAPVGSIFRARQRNQVGTSGISTSRGSPITPKKNEGSQANTIVLFGQRIVLEEKNSQNSSAATTVSNSIITSDGNNINKVKSFTGKSESGSVHNGKESSSDVKSSAETEIDRQTQTSGA